MEWFLSEDYGNEHLHGRGPVGRECDSGGCGSRSELPWAEEDRAGGENDFDTPLARREALRANERKPLLGRAPDWRASQYRMCWVWQCLSLW